MPHRLHSVVLAAAILAAVAGCAAPPGVLDEAREATTVYVAGHGMHTGLIVRSADVPAHAWPARADFPSAEYLELGWGDREYYMHPSPGPLLALRAVFWSTRSAIHAVGFSGPTAREFPASEIVGMQVSREGFARLVEFVRASHELGAAALGPGQRANSRFYASPRRFHLFETCNTWVARALEEAGMPVDHRRAVTAQGLLRQVRRLPNPAEPGGGAHASPPKQPTR